MNKNLNRKGFTLIELLAVIVILAILVMLAIPAVTKYLTAARQGAFSDNAQKAIDAVRTDVITNGFSADTNDAEGVTCQDSGEAGSTKTCVYSLAAINNLLEKKMVSSPFGPAYNTNISVVVVTQKYTAASGNEGESGYVPAKTEYIYQMCLIDNGNNGFPYTEEKSIKSNKIQVGGVAECGTAQGGVSVPTQGTTTAG